MALHLVSHSPEQTQHLGSLIGKLAQAGDVFLLVGNLGAGKTCLTQGMAWGLGVREYALSPSFVIVREYQGRLPLYHVDFYRLEHVEEIVDLGLDEYFCGRGVCVIEWAERAASELPQENLVIKIGYLLVDNRSIDLEPSGERYLELVGKLAAGLKEDKEGQWNWQ